MADENESWTPPYRLYVVEFEDGVVKAGISAQAKGRRIKSLAGSYGPILQHFTSDVVAGFAVEWEMLQRLAARAKCVRGREWFTGITFAEAVEVAKGVASSFEGRDPPKHYGRSGRTSLSLNSAELDLVERYARHVGKPLAQALRELAMSEIVGLVHGGNSLAAH